MRVIRLLRPGPRAEPPFPSPGSCSTSSADRSARPSFMIGLSGLLPMPNVPVNADVGNFEGIRNAISRENHVTAKGDIRPTQTSNWAVTYTRMRPFGLDPRYNTGGANDRTYSYAQERVASSFTIDRP